jgi:Asp-tRNA(Asn)/Glu-tRNA(Gln) amidotransferase A subunit family amidase
MLEYDLQSLRLPKLSGFSLSLFRSIVESPTLRPLFMGSLLKNGGVTRLRELVLEEPPTLLPLVALEPEPEPVKQRPVDARPRPANFPFKTIADFSEAYTSGKTTPLEVAEKVIFSIVSSDQSKPPLRAFIALYREDVMAQAQASTDRYKAGKPLSFLDGVPVAVKDELSLVPYPTTFGTSYIGQEPAKEDSTVVARLRAAGAMLLGKTNMHEVGTNPDGFNMFYGLARNPYNKAHDTGGSSSGSAAAVAAGFCPLALGADGGGSIRIPAALCGLVGLKPTFGRLSAYGVMPLAWSVDHLGPIGASVGDVALAYQVMAGVDPLDGNTQYQPPVRVDGWNNPDLTGITMGIYPAWFEHASPQVVASCKAMLRTLSEAGATLKEIVIPELDAIRVAHAVTILSELAATTQLYASHKKEQGDAVRLSLELGRAMTAFDYLQSQRMRTKAIEIFQKVFDEVDVVMTPATAITAPRIPANGTATGWSDLSTDTELMRYVFPGNFTGQPAITFPVGYDDAGLPVGMLAMGRHWEEHLLLRVAYAAEQSTERRLPATYYPIL